MEKRKKIAVYICAICLDSQRRMVFGILDEAKRKGYDVYIFTCYIGYEEEQIVKDGAYKIMDLPNPKDFDGVILVRNTLQDLETANRITQRVIDSGVPAVCIDENIEGLNYIGVSGYDAIMHIMDHLILDHGVKKIKYVAGIMDNKEGKDRYNAYIDAMLTNGLEVKRGDCFISDYSIEGGRKAVRYFLENDEVPEAIVCANDNMAVGVIMELDEHGIKCPDNVIVTGIDDDSLTAITAPGITTVDRNQELVGKKAVEMIAAEKKDTCIDVDSKLVARGSCGCKKTRKAMNRLDRSLYIRERLILDKAIENVRNMTVDMANLDDENRFEDVLQKYIKNSDAEKFWFCMCDKEKIFKVVEELDESAEDIAVWDRYSQYVTGYCFKTTQGKIGKEKLKSSNIIPRSEDELDEPPNFYVVSPVHYKNWCFGYCVSKNSTFPMYSPIYEAWVNNIGVGLENIRRKKVLKSLVDLLNQMWAYDTLTHVYNRAGFFARAKELVNENSDNRLVFIIFTDLDGLKKVNDTYGHDAGDKYITTMAEIIKDSLVDEEIVMRYGGDEFVIMGYVSEREDGERCKLRIQNKIDMFNYQSTLDYEISASMGVSTHTADELDALDKIIEAADKEMYIVKKNRKIQDK